MVAYYMNKEFLKTASQKAKTASQKAKTASPLKKRAPVTTKEELRLRILIKQCEKCPKKGELYDISSKKCIPKNMLHSDNINTSNICDIYKHETKRFTGEKLLAKYGILGPDYPDFIYEASNIAPDKIIYKDPKTGEIVYDYLMIFMLYLKHYNKITIEANFQFTNLPIYPNMKHFKTTSSWLLGMNIQPRMETCHIEFADGLEVFPTQPKLKILVLDTNNLLTVVKTQPEMTKCTLSDLSLKTFEYQPKLQYLIFEGKELLM
jgi:hypothetical protein